MNGTNKNEMKYLLQLSLLYIQTGVHETDNLWKNQLPLPPPDLLMAFCKVPVWQNAWVKKPIKYKSRYCYRKGYFLPKMCSETWFSGLFSAVKLNISYRWRPVLDLAQMFSVGKHILQWKKYTRICLQVRNWQCSSSIFIYIWSALPGDSLMGLWFVAIFTLGEILQKPSGAPGEAEESDMFTDCLSCTSFKTEWQFQQIWPKNVFSAIYRF